MHSGIKAVSAIFLAVIVIQVYTGTAKRKVTMSKDQNLPLEVIHKKNVSTFQAVIMISQEARFINEQANLGFIKLGEKPTTIAMQKFKLDRLQITDHGVAGNESVTGFDIQDSVAAA